ncbi:MAG: hypothetical protein WCB19_08160 [Thermoplasmata archaeon]
MTHERVSQPPGRIAELVLENGARMSLNEIRDLLEALDDRAYAEGLQDGVTSGADRRNEAYALQGSRIPFSKRAIPHKHSEWAPNRAPDLPSPNS